MLEVGQTFVGYYCRLEKENMLPLFAFEHLYQLGFTRGQIILYLQSRPSAVTCVVRCRGMQKGCVHCRPEGSSQKSKVQCSLQRSMPIPIGKQKGLFWKTEVCATRMKWLRKTSEDSGEDWSSSIEAERSFFLLSLLSHPGYKSVGWYHSHPGWVFNLL